MYMQKKILLANYLLILAIAFSRLLPHPMGMTPVGALGLYAGAYLNHRWAWTVPLIALLIGDAINGFYNIVILIAVYCGFAISAIIGMVLLKRKRSLARISAAIFIAELVFFLFSNTASWWVFYPHSFDGLLICYLNGLPFLGSSVLASFMYCAILFGGYELLKQWAGGRLSYKCT